MHNVVKPAYGQIHYFIVFQPLVGVGRAVHPVHPRVSGSFWPHVEVSLDRTLKSHSSAIIYVQLPNNNFLIGINK